MGPDGPVPEAAVVPVPADAVLAALVPLVKPLVVDGLLEVSLHLPQVGPKTLLASSSP